MALTGSNFDRKGHFQTKLEHKVLGCIRSESLKRLKLGLCDYAIDSLSNLEN